MGRVGSSGRGRPGTERARREVRRALSDLVRTGGGQPPILNIFVPHTGQMPSVAGLPFFMVIRFSLRISRFALHLTQ